MSSWILGPNDLDDLVFLPSIIFGTIFFAIYICRCKHHRCKIEEYSVITIYLRSAGFVAGAVLIINTVIAALTLRQTPLALYTFIAGLLVSIVSAKGLYHEIFKGGIQERSEGQNLKPAQPENPADPKSRAAD